jgi:hypothetical protein
MKTRPTPNTIQGIVVAEPVVAGTVAPPTGSVLSRGGGEVLDRADDGGSQIRAGRAQTAERRLVAGDRTCRPMHPVPVAHHDDHQAAVDESELLAEEPGVAPGDITTRLVTAAITSRRRAPGSRFLVGVKSASAMSLVSSGCGAAAAGGKCMR